MAELQGGNFGHGFAAAGFGSLASASPAVRQLSQDFAGRVVAGAVIGGTASRLAGGKFANGAVTAAFAYAFGEMARGDMVGSGGGAGAGPGNPSAEQFLVGESANAGQLFCTASCEASPDAAHAAAGNRYLGASIAARREAGWRVYDVGDGTYSFTYPSIGAVGQPGARLPGWLPGLSRGGSGHTHWDANVDFSGVDWRLVTGGRRSGPGGGTLYLAARDGRLQYATPSYARSFAVARGSMYMPPSTFPGMTVPNVSIRTNYP